MTTVVTVVRPFGNPGYSPEYFDMVSWAKENCKSYQNTQLYSVISKGYHYDFEFHTDYDATLFSLRWS